MICLPLRWKRSILDGATTAGIRPWSAAIFSMPGRWRSGTGAQARATARSASPAANPIDVRAVIRDRLSAPKQIGCSYRLTGLSSAAGFDAESWLPGEVIGRFFGAIG
jgi:hypothetical protein